MAGFYLLPALGNTKILYFESLSLFFVSAIISFYSKEKITKYLALLLVLTFWMILFNKGSSASLGLKDLDTMYNRIILVKDIDEESDRPILKIVSEADFAHSAIFLDEDTGPVFEYKKYFRLDEHFVPEIKRALAIGGAGYSYPKDFLKRKDGQIDVVEIDPEMTKVAKEYFNLEENERLNIYHEDARRFLERKDEKLKYDTIYLDAYLSSFVIPYQLTTIEAIERMHSLLNKDGAVFVNLVSALEGEGSKFIAAEYKTYKEIFPEVYVFKIVEDIDPSKRQNLLLVALKTKREVSFESDNENFNNYLKSVWKEELVDMPILTDDYAPIEQYLLSLY